MLAAGFNATTDWIGIAALLLAIVLLATNDLVLLRSPWRLARRTAEVFVPIGALTVIAWRFVIMI